MFNLKHQAGKKILLCAFGTFSVRVVPCLASRTLGSRNHGVCAGVVALCAAVQISASWVQVSPHCCSCPSCVALLIACVRSNTQRRSETKRCHHKRQTKRSHRQEPPTQYQWKPAEEDGALQAAKKRTAKHRYQLLLFLPRRRRSVPTKHRCWEKIGQR